MPSDSIEVYADVLCPFAHAAIRMVVGRRAEDDDRHRLRVRAWPLEIIDGRPADPDAIAHELDRLRATVTPDLFTGFDRARFPRTSLPAFALTAAAYRLGAAIGEAVALEIRDRLWERGEDVADPAVLHAVAESHGVVVTDDDHEEIGRDHLDGEDRGVRGSPHFFVGDAGTFCPPFTVAGTEDGGVRITPEPDRFDRFLAVAFH